MKKRLEEEFNLPPLEPEDDCSDDHSGSDLPAEFVTDDEIKNAISMSDKINDALREVRGMEVHDTEMDEIATEALESYKQLMDLGHNLTDMAAGTVFTSATQMLKVALDARDSKVNRKLKQISMMIQKASLDHRKESAKSKEATDPVKAQVLDRNDLMKILRDQNNTLEE